MARAAPAHRDRALTRHLAGWPPGQVRTQATGQDRRFAAAGLAGYLLLGWRYRHPPDHLEQRLFGLVNHSSTDYLVFRVPQQLGTPWVLPSLSLAAFWLRRPHLTIAAALALPAEKVLEVGTKKLLNRKRPAQADPDAVLHDDAPAEGPSYPSGHAAIASTSVFLLVPYIPAPVLAGAGLAAAASTAVRVRQGAHFPIDAVGGVLLGLTVGSGLTALVGRPTSPTRVLAPA